MHVGIWWSAWIFVTLAVVGLIAGSDELLALALVWFGFAVLASLALLVGAFTEVDADDAADVGASPSRR